MSDPVEHSSDVMIIQTRLDPRNGAALALLCHGCGGVQEVYFGQGAPRMAIGRLRRVLEAHSRCHERGREIEARRS